MLRRNWANIRDAPRRGPSGVFRSTKSASWVSEARSLCTTSRAPGRNTLTTTSLPVRVVARCTCARDAAASGSSSKALNSVETDAPSSASMAARTSATGTASTLSCKRASAVV